MNSFCEVCGMADMVLGDSSLYCRNCGAQSNQYIEEAFDAEDAHIFNTTFVREKRTLRNAEQQQPQSQPPGNALDEAHDGLDGLAELFGSHQDRQAPIELTPEVFNGSAPFSVKTEDLSQPGGSQFGQEVDPTSRMSQDELASTIRKSYLNGVQKILQLQLECLVKEFRATPLICGIAGPIWLRFVASTRVFEKAWAGETVMIAEHREKIRRESKTRVSPGPRVSQPLAEAAEAPSNVDGVEGKLKRKRVRKQGNRKERPGPRTSYGRHLSFVWLQALKERIPLSMTLAVSYLSCFIAREPILPTDIKSWAISGQLPYLAAFVEISKSAPHHIPNTVGEKQIFPMKPRLMFQPLRVPGARSVELLAGFVAERVGIELPPVNFHAICALFLRDLGLPVEKLLPYACRLYEWYAPSGLFLSARRTDLPTRVYVMAMLVITLKVLYNLEGRPLQQEEQINTHRINAQLPAMLTRARAKRQSSSEACIDEKQSTNSKKKIHGTQSGVTTSLDDHISESQVLGRRKMSQTTSGQDRGGQDGCEDVGISCKISGLKSLNKSVRFRDRQEEFGDAKDLLERLESSKTTCTVDFDEELSRYLKYCQNVLFAGDECDAGMEPVLERFWGIYENVTKVELQPVVNLDEEAAPAEGIGRKPVPKVGSPGSSDRAGGLETDAPSAASSMTGWRSRLEASKKKQEQKGKQKVLHTQNSKVPLVLELENESTKKRETSNLIADMNKAGFSCFPPLAFDVRWDEYVRYNFQDSGKGLIYVHEDYFRVLQACGKLISIHSRALHRCVQRIEKGLLQVESNVEQFLLGEKDLDVIELAKAVERRKPQRRRDKIAVTTFRAERNKHVKDLGYL